MNSDLEMEDEQVEAQIPAAEVEEMKKRAQGMSTHDLMLDPSAFSAGFSMLTNSLGLGFSAPGSSARANGRPQRQRPPTATSASSASESERERPRKRKVKNPGSETAPAPASSEVDEVDILSECSLSSAMVASGSESESGASSGNEWLQLQAAKGKIHLEELQNRFMQGGGAQINRGRNKTLNGRSKYGMDLDAEGVFLRGVFPDYDEKLRLFEENSKRIVELSDSHSKVLKHFDSIKDQLKDIFEGNLKSERMDYFLDNDMAMVNSLNISDPFPNDVFMLIANKVLSFLVPRKSKRGKYREFIQKVMISEALIRIYSLVNGVAFNQAEKEMRFGAEYDGPVPKILRGRAIEKAEGKSPKRRKKGTAINTREAEAQQPITTSPPSEA